MKYAPYRMCLACREKKEKDQLIKIVKQQSGIYIDTEKNKEGRGSYVCLNQNCIEKVCKNKLLNKAFKCFVNEDFYEQIKNNLK